MPVCVVAYVTLYVMYMYLKVRNTLWQAKPGSHARLKGHCTLHPWLFTLPRDASTALP